MWRCVADEERQISVPAEHARVAAYLAAYGKQVNVWEIGNEVNGDWTGSYPDVAAKLLDAYHQVKAARGLTALTVFADDLGPDHCGDGTSELSPAEFATGFLPASVRDGLSHSGAPLQPRFTTERRSRAVTSLRVPA